MGGACRCDRGQDRQAALSLLLIGGVCLAFAVVVMVAVQRGLLTADPTIGPCFAGLGGLLVLFSLRVLRRGQGGYEWDAVGVARTAGRGAGRLAWSEITGCDVIRGAGGYPEFHLSTGDGRKLVVDFDRTREAGQPLFDELRLRLKPQLEATRRRIEGEGLSLPAPAAERRVSQIAITLMAVFGLAAGAFGIYWLLTPGLREGRSLGVVMLGGAALYSLMVYRSYTIMQRMGLGLHLDAGGLRRIGEVGEAALPWGLVEQAEFGRMSSHGSSSESLAISGNGRRFDLTARTPGYLVAVAALRAKAPNARFSDRSTVSPTPMWQELLDEALAGSQPLTAEESITARPPAPRSAHAMVRVWSVLLLVGALTAQVCPRLLTATNQAQRRLTSSTAHLEATRVCTTGEPAEWYVHYRGEVDGEHLEGNRPLTPEEIRRYQAGDQHPVKYPDRAAQRPQAAAELSRLAQRRRLCLAGTGLGFGLILVSGLGLRRLRQRYNFAPIGRAARS